MDIKKFAVSPTSRLHLRDAAGELMYAEDANGNQDLSKPMAVNLYGPGSKEYVKAQTEMNNRIVARLQKKKTDQTPEQTVADKAKFLAGCTESWENVECDALTGNPLSIAVYSSSEIGFIAEQVGTHIGEWGNFSKPSTKTSASTSAKAPG